MDLPCPPVSTTSGERLAEKRGSCVIICEGSYDPNASHYPRVCNASQHPVVAQFMSMSRSAMIARYCTLHPEVAEGDLSAVLRKQPAHFKWAGCDLFVTGPSRRVCVVETNSCPSGQKSLPYADGESCSASPPPLTRTVARGCHACIAVSSPPLTACLAASLPPHTTCLRLLAAAHIHSLPRCLAPPLPPCPTSLTASHSMPSPQATPSTATGA